MVSAGLFALAGCNDEKQQVFDEAVKDLEQGSYEYARDEFITSVENFPASPWQLSGGDNCIYQCAE